MGEFTVEALSQGALDQLYFSLRVACADLLSQKAKLPLLIDDAFVHFDAERRQKAYLTLVKLSESRQIIYLTHDEQLAKELLKISKNKAKLELI